MRRELNGFFIIKQIKKSWLSSVLLKSIKEATSRVSLDTSFVL